MATSYQRFVERQHKAEDSYTGCYTLANYIIREQEIHEVGQVGLAYLELSDCLLKMRQHGSSTCNLNGLLDIWGRHCSEEYLRKMKSLDFTSAKDLLLVELRKLSYYSDDYESDSDYDC